MSHVTPQLLNFPPTPDSCWGIAHTPCTATHRSQVHVISLLHGYQETWLKFSNISIYRQKYKCKEIRVWPKEQMHPRNLQPAIPGHGSGTDEFLGHSTHLCWTVRNKISRCIMTLARRKRKEYNDFSYCLMLSKSYNTGLSNFSLILGKRQYRS